jgi:hypothetical protein
MEWNGVEGGGGERKEKMISFIVSTLHNTLLR